MRILLIGEYSRLHNSLKEGLLKLNHEVTLVGTNDGFKNFPVDINYTATVFTKSYLKPIVKLCDKLFGINIIEREYGYRFSKIIPELKDFDVVQLINENSIRTYPELEIRLLDKLIKNNKRTFLLSCGTDYTSVKYAFDQKFKYSILTPWHNDPTLKNHYKYILRYLSKPYYRLHKFLFEKVDGVIASDLDYHIPLKGNPKYLGLIPNPINTDKIKFEPLQIQNKVVIFHGVNKMNYIKKGNHFFDEALDIIQKKYPDKIDIIRTENVPYPEYIKAYKSCHIFLDQVYAFDQGFNALEAMACGKVVFTGAEQEWLNHYSIAPDTIAINALPEVNYLVHKLELLINSPNTLVSISKKAHDFVVSKHNYIKIAAQYLNTWSD